MRREACLERRLGGGFAVEAGPAALLPEGPIDESALLVSGGRPLFSRLYLDERVAGDEPSRAAGGVPQGDPCRSLVRASQRSARTDEIPQHSRLPQRGDFELVAGLHDRQARMRRFAVDQHQT